jgi:hypothetical protein
MQKYIKREVKYKVVSKEEEAYQPESIAIKVAIEFCLNIGTVSFLFQDMMSIFDQYGLREKFIFNLEPFIISGLFKKEYIPEEILKEFLKFYESKSDAFVK